ncbi:MAG TPA: hypothetical protein VKM54_19980 [Myxococcota bacterium]|nr:hypothetical protein [Myxococcota bacterium]
MAYRSGGYYGFAPYVPVWQRKARGQLEVGKLAKKRGRPAAPVVINGRALAKTFWGKAWCDNLERYSDYENRLPRGRTYARNGSVLDLHIVPGRVEALVAGSELYTVNVDITRLVAARWKRVIAACAGRIDSLIGLLRGELSDDVLAVLTETSTGLFPAPREITMRCSCPDAAGMCKHIAATLYGVGARLDERPELFFVLRQVDQADLLAGARVADVMATAGAKGAGTGKKRLARGAVAAVFGIEIDEGEPATMGAEKTPARKPRGRRNAKEPSAIARKRRKPARTRRT